MKVAKRLQSQNETFDSKKSYTVAEAIKILKKFTVVKFDATAEVHFRLGINPKHADQQIRSTISLPNGTGRTAKVVVFCEDDKVKEALDAGAVAAGGQELIDKVAKSSIDFSVAVSTPGMMKDLAKIARILGPRGQMPSPKAGTVTPKIKETVKELVAGRLEIKNDKNGIVHTVFGKMSFGDKLLEENLLAMIEAIKNAKPSGSKGEYIRSVSINSTMSKGIKIAVE